MPGSCSTRCQLSGGVASPERAGDARARLRTVESSRTVCERVWILGSGAGRDLLPPGDFRTSPGGARGGHLRRGGGRNRRLEGTVGCEPRPRRLESRKDGCRGGPEPRANAQSWLAFVQGAAMLRPMGAALRLSDSVVRPVDPYRGPLETYQRSLAPCAPRSHPRREVGKSRRLCENSI